VLHVTYGVLQRCIQSPLLLPIYVIERPSVIKHYELALCWWHNTLIFLLKPSWHGEHREREDLIAIANWMLICSHFKLSGLKSITDRFMFWTTKIRYWSCWIFRGFTFLQHYVAKQVEHVISRVKQRLSRLHRIKRLSPHNACLLHSSSLVLLILDYADTVWVDKDNETKTKRQNRSALLELLFLYSAYSFVAHRK